MELLKVLVYGDINLNIIDGSAIWLTSMLNVLSINENVKVDLLLKMPIKNNEMINSIYNYKDINKIEMFEKSNRLTPEEAVENMINVNEINSYDCIIIRGFEINLLAAKRKELKDKLVAYITNFEHDNNKISSEERKKLKFVYNNCAYFCAQTPESRDSLKVILEVEEAEKFIILNPMIPDYPTKEPNFENRNNRLIYSGKFAKDWHTDKIIDSFVKISKDNCEMKLTVVGNLFRADLNDEKENILNILNNNININWIKGVDRIKSNELIKESDLGIAWRSENVDNDKSVELSTKVLEYCRAAKPILLNRIKMHEDLLGKDYPLFVDDKNDFENKIKLVLSDETIYRKCSKIVYEVGKEYTFKESYKRLHSKLWRFKSKKTKIVFAGHDLKFLQKFIDYINVDETFDMRVDKWDAHDRHNKKYSQECLEWADVIFCEWGLGNAKWYSQNKKSWQKLIVRMHLQERDTIYNREFNYNNIDKIIAISPYIYEEFACKINVPREKMTMIYNYIDCEKFKLEKLAGCEFNLGIVGVCPQRKRLDLAIDILEELVKKDKRYNLYIKGKRPEEYRWVWKKQEERDYYEEIFDRIEQEGLSENVIYDGHGSDMEEWFRKIGYTLSTSDFESFHLAPAEGMCSGSIPVIRDWEGSNTIYDNEYIIKDLDKAIDYILENKNNVGNERYKEYVNNKFDKSVIFEQIKNLISENIY